MKINKNQVYVINQPKHNYSSILIIDDVFPINEKAHQKIYELCKMSDVLFVFKNDAHKRIDLDKFSSLYESCAYIESEGNISKTVLKLMLYDSQIFERHSSTVVVNSPDEIANLDIDKLFHIVQTPIINEPVFEIRRLTSEEFFDIYKKEDVTCKFFSIPTNNPSLKYCSYTSNSNAIIFRANTINIMLEFADTGKVKDYVDSFAEKEDIRYFFGSLIKYLGIKNLDREYKDIEV